MDQPGVGPFFGAPPSSPPMPSWGITRVPPFVAVPERWPGEHGCHRRAIFFARRVPPVCWVVLRVAHAIIRVWLAYLSGFLPRPPWPASGRYVVLPPACRPLFRRTRSQTAAISSGVGSFGYRSSSMCPHHSPPKPSHVCQWCQLETAGPGAILFLVDEPKQDCPCAKVFAGRFICTCPEQKSLRYGED